MAQKKEKKIDFRLDGNLYKAIEAMAKKQGVKRGTMVRKLVEKGVASE